MDEQISTIDELRSWAAGAMLAAVPRIVGRVEEEPPAAEAATPPAGETPPGDESTPPEGDGGTETQPGEPGEGGDEDPVARSEWFKALDPRAQKYITDLRTESKTRREIIQQYSELGPVDELRSRLEDVRISDDPEEALRRFYTYGEKLGIGQRQLSALLLGETPQPSAERHRPDPDDPWAEDVDEERPLTRSEMLEILTSFDARAQEQQLRTLVTTAIDEEFEKVGIDGRSAMGRAIVDEYARQFLPDGVFEPSRVRHAIRQGIEAFRRDVATTGLANGGGVQNALELTDVQPPSDEDFAAELAASAARTPTTLRGGRGGVPGSSTPNEDFDFDEGIARARQRLRKAGLIS